jgi:hypothetical protein
MCNPSGNRGMNHAAEQAGNTTNYRHVKVSSITLPCGATCEARENDVYKTLLNVKVDGHENFCRGSGSHIELHISKTGIRPLIRFLQGLEQDFGC